VRAGLSATTFRMTAARTLRQRLVVNAAAYGYGPVVMLLVQVVQVPLFLHFWGIEKYGEWLVLTGIPLMLVLADAGVAQASASKCIMEVGSRSFQEARNTLRTARVYTTLVSLLLGLAALFLASFVDWAALLKLTTVSRSDAALVFLLVSCYVAVSLQGGYLGAWLRSSDQTPIHAFIEGTTRLVDILAIGCALLMGGGFVAVALALLASSILCRAGHTCAAHLLSAAELKASGRATWGQLRGIAKPSLAYVGITLTQTFTVQGGIQVLNQISTQQTVVLFNTVRILVRALVLLGGAISNALRPELSRLVGAGQQVLASRVAKRVSAAVLVPAVLVYFAFVAIGPFLIGVWTDNKVEATHTIVSLVGVHALLNVWWLLVAALSISKNQHARYAAVYATSAVVTMALWIIGRDYVWPVLGASLLLALPEFAVVLFASSSFSKNVSSMLKRAPLHKHALPSD
jgi:O-antigen/teichoic acid export membrane protein